ncbi:anti-sigma factor family protein [Azospirillum brasilense]|uniref:anti-sigma factor family protein n=1 Tax=Azospirillum brasilense TaxID=192 RepID=UPI001FFE30A3|nr:zf-HC2 domain-containing protein [Azospirillum brasilense]
MDTEPDAPVTEADLHAWMDGELPEERRGEVERHLAGNPDLARRFDRYRAQRAMLQDTFGPLIERPLPAALVPPYARTAGRPAVRA